MFLSAAVLGVSDGMIWCTGAWIVVKIFGNAHSSTIFGMVVFSAACVELLLSYGLETVVYNSKPHTTSTPSECSAGIACFRLTNVVTGALVMFAVGLSAYFKSWFQRHFRSNKIPTSAGTERAIRASYSQDDDSDDTVRK